MISKKSQIKTFEIIFNKKGQIKVRLNTLLILHKNFYRFVKGL